jgi:hypothetical protein
MGGYRAAELGAYARHKGDEATGPNDRGKPGSKRHRVVDCGGIPLALILLAATLAWINRFRHLMARDNRL